MDCITQRIPYRQTESFTNIVLDYLDQADSLKPFFSHSVTLEGINETIAARKFFSVNRKLLVEVLQQQYQAAESSGKVKENIELLLSENTFTITTAHQPNIFTGPLYFIYKILHTIRLADHLNTSLPGNKFVPVFYMGSEDADFDELGHIYINGEKISWETKQTGAVGRMKIDKEFIKLIELMEGQISILPFGNEIIELIKKYYKSGDDIQTATFRFVNALFGEYGLMVLMPDNTVLKKTMQTVFEDDLLNQTASGIVEQTSEKLEELYKVQVSPREINLLYLKENVRERIIKNSRYKVQGTSMEFSEDELMQELNDHPELFSPNVILRGLYQEMILPNIIFIGGGGEIAYWLQLKELFEHYKVPFPVLVLRNSFLVVEKKWQEKINRLSFNTEDFFLSEQELMKRLINRESKNEIHLDGQIRETELLYESLKKQAALVDTTLGQHVDALKTSMLKKLKQLEKKMLRAEKRKFTYQERQIKTIKEKLFPKNSLQERVDNFIPYYAKWGKDFIIKLYEHSLGLEQEFVVVIES